MREILIAVGTLGASLAIVAGSVFAGGDTGLFVPPPEAVAEAFAREVGNGRYDLARRHLSRSARDGQSAAAIEAQFSPIKGRVGAIDSAEATEISRNANRAAAACELTGEHGAVALTFALTREQGLWAIDSWHAQPVR